MSEENILDHEAILEKSRDFIEDLKFKKDKILAEARHKELMQNYSGEDKVIPFLDVYNKSKDRKIEYMSTGWEELDMYLGGGIKKKDIVVLHGFSGMGKTNFALNLTRNMEKYNPFWLPYEESAGEFADKLVYWNQEPFKFFTPEKLLREDIPYIEERILEAKIKYGSDIVFLDNLHYIAMTEDSNKSMGKAAFMSKQLKEIAKKLNVAIVVIAHVRKSTEGMHKVPSYEDIAGDSNLFKVASSILGLWRECEKDKIDGSLTYTGYTKISVQKVRSAGGQLRPVYFSWDKGRFIVDSLRTQSEAKSFTKKEEKKTEDYSKPKIDYDF